MKYRVENGCLYLFIECQHEAAVEFWLENERLRARDREAGEHVEAVIAMRTKFTGEPPYVGWKGLGLALSEALDERDRLQSLNAELLAACKASEAVMDKANGLHAIGAIAFADDFLLSLQRALVMCKQSIARCEAGRESGPCT